MIALIRVELTRLRLRRAVLLLAAAAVLIPAVILGAVAFNTRPVSASDLRSAQETVDRDIASGTFDRDLRRCVKRPGQYGISVGQGGDAQAACEDAILPKAEWYTYRDTLDLTREREDNTGLAVAVLLAMLMLVVGTTFVGHDWSSGSMSNQLLFEPRRSRVWLAKAVVVLGAGSALSLAVLAAYWTGLWAFAASRDVPIAPHAVAAAYKQAVLAAALAGLAGVAGYGLTMLFRSTVATLGILFALAAAGTLLISALGLAQHVRIQPQANVQAYLVGSYTSVDYDDPECSGSSGPPPASCTTRIDRGGASLYLGGLLLLATVPSVLSFRRRDVP